MTNVHLFCSTQPNDYRNLLGHDNTWQDSCVVCDARDGKIYRYGQRCEDKNVTRDKEGMLKPVVGNPHSWKHIVTIPEEKMVYFETASGRGSLEIGLTQQVLNLTPEEKERVASAHRECYPHTYAPLKLKLA